MFSLHSQLAVSGEDYVSISGSLTFDEGVVTQSFSLLLVNDSLPEVDEYVFVAITSVDLDITSVDNVDTSGV